MDHPEQVGLSPHERVALDDIERTLAALDPRLAERLTTHVDSSRRWRVVRLPAGAAGVVAGLAAMVVAAVAGDLGAVQAATGIGGVGLAAAGTVALADEACERVGGSIGQWWRARRQVRRPHRGETTAAA